MRKADEASFEARDREQRELAARWLADHPDLGVMRLKDDIQDHKLEQGNFRVFKELHRLGGVLRELGPPEPTEDDEDLALRLARVFDALLPQHQQLLEERYLERRTLEDMGESRAISKQAVHQRLLTAERDFTKLFGEQFAVGL